MRKTYENYIEAIKGDDVGKFHALTNNPWNPCFTPVAVESLDGQLRPEVNDIGPTVLGHDGVDVRQIVGPGSEVYGIADMDITIEAMAFEWFKKGKKRMHHDSWRR